MLLFLFSLQEMCSRYETLFFLQTCDKDKEIKFLALAHSYIVCEALVHMHLSLRVIYTHPVFNVSNIHLLAEVPVNLVIPASYQFTQNWKYFS